MKGPTSEGQLLSLINEGANDFGMTVSLVNRRIGRKKIEVFFALDIIDLCSWRSENKN